MAALDRGRPSRTLLSVSCLFCPRSFGRKWLSLSQVALSLGSSLKTDEPTSHWSCVYATRSFACGAVRARYPACIFIFCGFVCAPPLLSVSAHFQEKRYRGKGTTSEGCSCILHYPCKFSGHYLALIFFICSVIMRWLILTSNSNNL
jgi:hypothetical protein